MMAPFFVCTIWQTFRSLTLFKDGKFASPWNLLCEMKRRPKALTADPSAIIHFFSKKCNRYRMFRTSQAFAEIETRVMTHMPDAEYLLDQLCRKRSLAHMPREEGWTWSSLLKEKGARVFLFARPTDLRIVEEVKKCDDTSRKCNAKFT